MFPNSPLPVTPGAPGPRKSLAGGLPFALRGPYAPENGSGRSPEPTTDRPRPGADGSGSKRPSTELRLRRGIPRRGVAGTPDLPSTATPGGPGGPSQHCQPFLEPPAPIPPRPSDPPGPPWLMAASRIPPRDGAPRIGLQQATIWDGTSTVFPRAPARPAVARRCHGPCRSSRPTSTAPFRGIVRRADRRPRKRPTDAPAAPLPPPYPRRTRPATGAHNPPEGVGGQGFPERHPEP